MSNINPKIFRAYDIRGKYPNDLNENVAELIGRALVQFLHQPTNYESKPITNIRNSKKFVIRRDQVVVGYDCRLSSPALFKALAKGITEQGANVINIGEVTTDTLYFAQGKLNANGGVMITASHLGKNMNGFKMLLRGPRFLCGDFGLPEIKKMVIKYPSKFSSKTWTGKKFKTKGKISKKNILPDYINHILKIFNSLILKPPYKMPSQTNRKTDNLKVFLKRLKQIKVVIDAGNGVGGPLIKEIFSAKNGKWSKLSFDHFIIPLYFEPNGNFPNHEPNPLIPKNIKNLQKRVRKEKANLGVAYDGDADRVVFVDEKGQIISGDMIIELIAEIFLKKESGATICYNLTCSHALPERINQLGGKPVRTRTGHAFMKGEMRSHNAIFGGEISGHIYYRDNFYAECGPLTFLLVLGILVQKKKPLSELIKNLQKYYRIGEINFEVKNRAGKIKKLEKKYADGKIDYLDGLTVEYKDWWFNARPSNTEPLLRVVIEAKTKEVAEKKLKEITEILQT